MSAETLIAAMVRVELAQLPRPARELLGVTVKHPEPALADGWSWIAWRSEGRRWRNVLKDRPAGWLAEEHYSVRLAGPWATGPWVTGPDGAQRWRAVALWSRPLVHLGKGSVSKRTGRRGIGSASWSSEAWLWRAGRAGSVPRPVGVGEVVTLARTGRPSAAVWEVLAGEWAVSAARSLLIAELNALWVESESEEGQG